MPGLPISLAVLLSEKLCTNLVHLLLSDTWIHCLNKGEKKYPFDDKAYIFSSLDFIDIVLLGI